MRLGEALNRRADLGRRLSELRGRVAGSATAQEGEEPPESIDDLMVEAEELAQEFESLVVRINLTNAAVEVESGQTITAALAQRDSLALQQGILQAAIEGATGGRYGLRYGRNELKTIRYVDPSELRKSIDHLAAKRRELDNKLQEINWTVDLV